MPTSKVDAKHTLKLWSFSFRKVGMFLSHCVIIQQLKFSTRLWEIWICTFLCSSGFVVWIGSDSCSESYWLQCNCTQILRRNWHKAIGVVRSNQVLDGQLWLSLLPAPWFAMDLFLPQHMEVHTPGWSTGNATAVSPGVFVLLSIAGFKVQLLPFSCCVQAVLHCAGVRARQAANTLRFVSDSKCADA